VADLQTFLGLLGTYGVTPLLVVGLVILAREYRRIQHECRRWQRLALTSMADANHAAELAEFFRGEA
jgi:hypothetical protein